VLSQPRADTLVESLDLDLSVGLCYACLGMVAWAVEHDDDAEIGRVVRRVTRDMWDEGLAELAIASVRAAYAHAVPDADMALADLECNAWRGRTARTIVTRLGRMLAGPPTRRRPPVSS
jgi:hypothetical protein